MNTKNEKTTLRNKIIIGVASGALIALLVGASAPWWWSEVKSILFDDSTHKKKNLLQKVL